MAAIAFLCGKAHRGHGRSHGARSCKIRVGWSATPRPDAVPSISPVVRGSAASAPRTGRTRRPRNRCRSSRSPAAFRARPGAGRRREPAFRSLGAHFPQQVRRPGRRWNGESMAHEQTTREERPVTIASGRKSGKCSGGIIWRGPEKCVQARVDGDEVRRNPGHSRLRLRFCGSKRNERRQPNEFGSARQEGHFSLRQFTEPRVSIVLDSSSRSKPLRIRYFSASAEPLPTIDTP